MNVHKELYKLFYQAARVTRAMLLKRYCRGECALDLSQDAIRMAYRCQPDGIDICDLFEAHTEQEEKDFLNSLGDEDDFDPASVQVKAQTEKVELEAAAGMVCLGLMTIEQTMKGMVHPGFAFDPEQAENVAQKVAPLIVKYGGNPPPWLAQYMDEIMAVAAVGMLALTSWMQVKQLKAADIQAAKEKAKNAANEEPVEQEAA